MITRRAKDAALPICSNLLESQFVFCFDIAAIGLTPIQSHAAFQMSLKREQWCCAGAEHHAATPGSLLHKGLNIAGGRKVDEVSAKSKKKKSTCCRETSANAEGKRRRLCWGLCAAGIRNCHFGGRACF